MILQGLIYLVVFIVGVVIGWYGRHYRRLAEHIYDTQCKKQFETVMKK